MNESPSSQLGGQPYTTAVPPAWTMRPTTPTDAPTVTRHRYPDASADDLKVYAEWVAGAMERGIYLGWIIEACGQVVAGLGLTLLEWGPTKTDPSPVRARVVNVFTAPEYRRQGLAAALLERASIEATARGIRTMNLGTTEQARSLYARHGFKVYAAEMVRQSLV